MVKRAHILVSTRDVGAAAHTAEIVPFLRATEDMTVTLVADEPALTFLRTRGIEAATFTGGVVAGPNAPNAARLRTAARTLLAATNPDAILVGLSGAGIGIDEALLAEASGVPTYAVQDYSGWTVPGFGVGPQTYFVADTTAARATKNRAQGIRTIVAGSAKYAKYCSLDLTLLREAGRAGFSGTGPLIGFYGQSASFLAGYERAIKSLAAAICAVAPQANVFYRPHPKETTQEQAHIIKLFLAAGVELRIDIAAAAEQSLCAADIVATCFSSCATDHIHLQQRSQRPLGTVLYLMAESDLQTFHAHHTGAEVPAFAAAGLAVLNTDKEKLPTDLCRCLEPGTADRLWRRIRRELPDPVGASQSILSTIRGDIGLTAMPPRSPKKKELSS